MPITVKFYAYYRKILCLLLVNFKYINELLAPKTRYKTKNKLKRKTTVDNSIKFVRYITFCNIQKDVENKVFSFSKQMTINIVIAPSRCSGK